MAIPLSFSFATLADYDKFVAHTVNALGVYSRTSVKRSQRALHCARKLSGEDLVDSYGFLFPKLFGYYLDQVLYALEWGRKTGRFHIQAEQMLDSLSGYQFAKFVVRIALASQTVGDVVAYVNGRHSFPLPIAV